MTELYFYTKKKPKMNITQDVLLTEHYQDIFAIFVMQETVVADKVVHICITVLSPVWHCQTKHCSRKKCTIQNILSR